MIPGSRASSGDSELDHSRGDHGAHGRNRRGAPSGGAGRRDTRDRRRRRASPSDGGGDLHADGAVAGDVAVEVARAGARERDVGRPAPVVAERVAAGAGEVVALAHLRHRVLLALVVEHCNPIPTACPNARARSSLQSDASC
jgi:hypothetical protein